ncbi:hypothetical protein [Leekyejoonella antrihumi]|uniref:hypothetical protein n=1 Tax=Leekyejoonella antrihumi TaxID=1660198 RepID=UPI001648C95C|nr:hypothetical protein [Leekyejoonella antrihumi]
MVTDLQTNPVVADRRRECEEHLRLLDADHDDQQNHPDLQHQEQYTALRLALIGRNAPPSSVCVTNSASTTPCSASSSADWTSKKYDSLTR